MLWIASATQEHPMSSNLVLLLEKSLTYMKPQKYTMDQTNYGQPLCPMDNPVTLHDPFTPNLTNNYRISELTIF